MFGGFYVVWAPLDSSESWSVFLMARRLANVLRFGVSKSQTGLAEEGSCSYDRCEDELQQWIIARLLFGGVTAL